MNDEPSPEPMLARHMPLILCAASTLGVAPFAVMRAFLAKLSEVIASFERTSTPSSLVLLDIDHFKRINDAHGHSAGDEILRRVAHRIESRVRLNAVAADSCGRARCARPAVRSVAARRLLRTTRTPRC